MTQIFSIVDTANIMPQVLLSCYRIMGLPFEILKIHTDFTKRKRKRIALIITGNPGMACFYEAFAIEIFHKLNETYSVWVVSHSNFCEDNGDIGLHYSSILDKEYHHKLILLQHEVPEDADVILVGHSIGCYVILNMLSSLNGEAKQKYRLEAAVASAVYDKILHCFMLFPAMQNLRDAPNSRRLNFVFKYLRGACSILAYIVSKLPMFLRRSFANLFLPSGVVEKCVIDGAVSLIVPKFIRNVLSMAIEELIRVVDLDFELIKRNIDKLTFYYGVDDGWCPIRFYRDLKKNIPNVDAHVDSRGIDHSFVVKHSQMMAEVLSQKINLWEAEDHFRYIL